VDNEKYSDQKTAEEKKTIFEDKNRIFGRDCNFIATNSSIMILYDFFICFVMYTYVAWIA
jgi:hypothetical protein